MLDPAYFVQFAVSAVAICVMAAVAAWAKIPRPTPPLDEARARELIAGELPEVAIGEVWIDKTGDTAIARSGDEAVVLFRVGDSYAVRQAPWDEVRKARSRDGRVVIAFHDPGAPAATFRLSGERAPFLEVRA